MQVSQTASALQALQRANQQTPASKQPVQVEIDQEKQQKSKQQNRFDIDEQGLILVEQSRQHEQKSTSSPQEKKAGYDQPSRHNQTAVLTYQSVGHLKQRENIEQMFGVDLLA